MMKSLDQLPDDVASLKQLIVDLSADYQAQLDKLKAQIRLMVQRQYGRSTEAAPGQQTLFNEVEAIAADQPLDASDTTGNAAAEPASGQGRCRRGGRRALPAHLPRLEIVHELDEDERRCPEDGCALREIGEEVSERLEFIPATLRVIRQIRKKYACPSCENTVRRAPLPPSLVPKSQASASLLAQIAVAKYQDGLPLHRQEAIFARHGVELSRTTLAHWLLAVGERLAPLSAALQRDLLKARVLHSDETVVQVLKEPGRRAEQRSYMWLMVSGSGPPIVRYHYAPSRARAVVTDLLGDYRGTLVSDGYAAYDAVPARHAGCWAHVRRKFHDALKVQTGTRTGKAQVGFQFIQRLFALEHAWRALDAETRRQQRQREAAPLLDELKGWLDQSLLQVAPQTLTGKALGYLAGQWPKLTVFLDDGEIPIHNNLAENKIRPFVIGRKNWLFADTVAGAHTSAALYSLIETAKANDLEPFTYLHWLFTVLPTIDPANRAAVDVLLPYRVDRESIVTTLAAQYSSAAHRT